MVIFCANPYIRMSLLVTKDIWPAVVSTMECYDISYGSEKELKDGKHVRINDISGKGVDITKMVDALNRFVDDSEGKPRKIYILFSAKRAKKEDKENVQKDRAEAGNGCEGGTAEGADDIRHGSDPDDSGTGDWPDCAMPDELQCNKADVCSEDSLTAAADNCDQ